MKKTMLMPILGGVFLGAFVFFTGPLLFIIFVLKFIFTPFGMGRMRYGRMGMPSFAFAQKIRNMSDEDYNDFQNRMKDRWQGSCRNMNEPIN